MLATARAADPVAVLRDVGVLIRKRVPPKTLFLLGRCATPGVFPRRHDFQVTHIDAAAISAQVIEVQPLRDGADLTHVRKTVGVLLHSVE